MSYSRNDEVATKTLVRVLEKANRKIWFDNDLAGGDVWWDTILGNIRTCPVFLFCTSDHSLRSAACRSEVDYAIALHRQIVPVQVGPMTMLPASALMKYQVIPFDAADAVTAGGVLGALERAEHKQEPLPVPLPREPSIPYAYLQVLGDQIFNRHLDEAAQAAVVEQLGKALDDETDQAVLKTIGGMLRMLSSQPSTTNRSRGRIRVLLLAHGLPVDETTEQPTEAIPIAPGARRDIDDDADAKGAFLARFRQLETADQSAPPWTGEDLGPRFPGVREVPADEPRHRAGDGPDPTGVPVFSAEAGSDTVGNPHVVPGGHEDPQPERRFPGVSPGAAQTGPTRPTQAGTASASTEVGAEASPSPPTRRALGIGALLLSVVCALVVAVVGRGATSVTFALPAACAAVSLAFSRQAPRRHTAGDQAGAVRASRTSTVWGIAAGVVAVAALAVILATPGTV